MERYILVYDGQIAGESNTNENLPSGWIAIASQIPLDSAYYADGQIFEKPPQPTPFHYWDTQENKWKLPAWFPQPAQ